MHEDQNIDKQPSNEVNSAEHSCVEVNNQKRDILTPHNAMDKPCVCGKQGCSCVSEAVKATPPSYIYAIGKVFYRFPTKSIEQELAQATGRRADEETRGLTREEVMHKGTYRSS